VPLSLGRYLYCRNDPVDYADYDGRIPVSMMAKQKLVHLSGTEEDWNRYDELVKQGTKNITKTMAVSSKVRAKAIEKAAENELDIWFSQNVGNMTVSQKEYYDDAKAKLKTMRENGASQAEINQVLLVACTALHLTVKVPGVGVFTPDNPVLIEKIPEILPWAHARELIETANVPDKTQDFLNIALDIARNAIGDAYIRGVWDCSAFVNKALREFFGDEVNIAKWISGGSSSMRNNMGDKKTGKAPSALGWYKGTDFENMQPGDLIFWNDNAKSDAGHVAIYLGDGYILDVAKPEDGQDGVGIHRYDQYNGPKSPTLAEYYRPDYSFHP